MITRRRFLEAALVMSATAIAGLISGCAHPQLIDYGSSEAQIMKKLGNPHARVEMPNGWVRLTYSWQPVGQAVWWLFLDSSGHYAKLEQALTEKNFPLVKPGMTQQAILELFGPCAEIYRFAALKQTSFMYRYEDDMKTAMALWVDFDASGHVISWSTSTDPWLDKPFPGI